MMVSEHWNDEVKLRVIEAWDDDCAHEEHSLHYEGAYLIMYLSVKKLENHILQDR